MVVVAHLRRLALRGVGDGLGVSRAAGGASAGEGAGVVAASAREPRTPAAATSLRGAAAAAMSVSPRLSTMTPMITPTVMRWIFFFPRSTGHCRAWRDAATAAQPETGRGPISIPTWLQGDDEEMTQAPQAAGGSGHETTRGRVDRTRIAVDLQDARRDLHALLAAATPAQLRRTSDGTRWTNEQLLFHMVFGFLVVRRLLPLVRLVSRLPAPVGTSFAGLLDAGTKPFHVINYLGSCGGALVFDRNRMGRLCDHTIAVLCARLEAEPESRLHRTMPFPTSWDPYFTASMTLEDVYAYPVLHYRHHRAQLTLEGG